MAWSAAVRLKSIWKSQIDINLKKQFFNSTIISVLLYGCETWSLTKGLNKRLDGTYTKLLRYITNISWKEKIKNEILYSGW